MADHYEQQRFWFDTAALRALAIATTTDIVVVYDNGSLSWYPADEGHVFTAPNPRGRRASTFRTTEFASLTHPTYATGAFIPPVAFEPSTVVMCHSGVHFWCTKVTQAGYRNLDNHLASCRSYCQRAGKVLQLTSA
jgi:hypothetical protein